MKNIAALLLIVFIAACTPERPGNVPESAFWAGGPTAKVWVNLIEVRDDGFEATIYREDGEKWVSGIFLFTPPPKEPYVPKGVDAAYIEKYMNAFDGTTIALSDFAGGRTLVYELRK